MEAETPGLDAGLDLGALGCLLAEAAPREGGQSVSRQPRRGFDEDQRQAKSQSNEEREKRMDVVGKHSCIVSLIATKSGLRGTCTMGSQGGDNTLTVQAGKRQCMHIEGGGGREFASQWKRRWLTGCGCSRRWEYTGATYKFFWTLLFSRHPGFCAVGFDLDPFYQLMPRSSYTPD